ncbi:hypothetical protein ACLG6S_14315 [Thermodesulfobacteriota bacterium B35]
MLSQPQQRIDVTDNPLFSPGGPDRPPRPAAWCCALLQQAWQWIAFTCRRGPVPVCLVTCLWLLAATAGASVTPPAIRLLEEKHPPESSGRAWLWAGAISLSAPVPSGN